MKQSQRNTDSIKDRMISVNIYKAWVPTILLALVLMLVSVSFSGYQIFIRSQDVIHSIESSIATYLERYISSLDEVYYAIYKQNPSKVRMQKALDAYNESNRDLIKIWVIDEMGRSEIGTPYASTDSGYDHSGHEYFYGLEDEGQIIWSDVFIVIGSNEPVVTVSKKFEDAVVVLRINLKDLTDYLSVFDISENSSIAVTDSRGAYLAHTDGSFVATRAYDPNRINLMSVRRDYVDYNNKFMYAYHTLLGDTQWSIIYYQSLSDFMMPIVFIIISGLIILVVIGYRAVSAVMKLNNDILFELNGLVDWTKRVSLGAYDRSPRKHSFDEFEQLSSSFHKMINDILNRELELRSKKQEIVEINESLELEVQKRTHDLEMSLEELKKTQRQLVVKEKMASLGNLVSGVAHELNTPIGVAVTAASYLEKKNQDIHEKLVTSSINKHSFIEYIGIVDESSQIILRNMERASELIQSFKKVAIDQEKMTMEAMDLKTVVEATVMSYSVELKNHGVQSELKFEGDLKGYSYPGAISQVLANLIQNSLMHAFQDENNNIERATIGIECASSPVSKYYEIRYWDNGRGIDESHIEKIYDPFYTTALNSGGTGLGMNIVYNLITGLLKGEIRYDRKDAKGVNFIITIPKHL